MPDEERAEAQIAGELLLANFDMGLARVRAELEQSERLLIDAQERDRVQAERPPDCICLGVGGAGVMVELPGDLRVWSRPCTGCPEGRAQATPPLADDDSADRPELPDDLGERMDAARLPRLSEPLEWSSFDGEPAKAPAVERVRRFAEGPPDPLRPPGLRPDGTLVPARMPATRGALLTGPFGTGKSSLCALACRDWTRAGGTALFTTLADYLELLRPADERRVVERPYVPERALRVGLLVLDDLGAETLTSWGREKLFVLVNARNDAGRPTLYTSNYDPDEIVGRFIERGGDRREGLRIMERVAESADMLLLAGRNYRERVTA